MLISLDKIVKDYKLNIRGVLHIGAHYGQEYFDYIKQDIENIIFFEPVRSNFEKLIKVLPKIKSNIFACNMALGNEEGLKEMFIETVNQGQSCSILEPGTHLKLYPEIKFDKKETVVIDRLDNIFFDRVLFNMINIDVQGYELEVFKGAVDTLSYYIDIIYTEINTEEVYKNCCLVEELDKFLETFGFKRMLTQMACKSWGDALYLKQ